MDLKVRESLKSWFKTNLDFQFQIGSVIFNSEIDVYTNGTSRKIDKRDIKVVEGNYPEELEKYLGVYYSLTEFLEAIENIEKILGNQVELL